MCKSCLWNDEWTNECGSFQKSIEIWNRLLTLKKRTQGENFKCSGNFAERDLQKHGTRQPEMNAKPNANGKTRDVSKMNLLQMPAFLISSLRFAKIVPSASGKKWRQRTFINTVNQLKSPIIRWLSKRMSLGVNQ